VKRLAPLLVGLCFGCEKPAAPNVPPPAPPSAQLRVPLPDGWRGTASTDGLSVGPEGRTVLQLERTSRPFPSLEALTGAIDAEGVELLQKESTESFVGVKYLINADGVKAEGFLGVRQAGAHTIWCSTTGGARGDEVEQAMTVCRDVANKE
jgi:hypothetical protein